MPSPHSDKHREFIKAKFEEGYSPKSISVLLQSAFKVDLSRNAVGGIIDRMGLKRSGQKVKSYFTTKPVKKSQPMKSQEPIPTVEPAPIGPLNDFPSGARCKYTRDDPAKHNFRMCGHKTSGIDNPWCAYHERVVFSGTQQKAA